MKPSEWAKLYVEDCDNDYIPEDSVTKCARAYLRLREAVLRYKRDGSMKHLGELWKALEETDEA
jgi:hypothetical protein